MREMVSDVGRGGGSASISISEINGESTSVRN